MIRAIRKTSGRTGRFLGRALSWRLPDREFAPVAWGLVAGAIWIVANLAGDPGDLAHFTVSIYLVLALAAISAVDARFGIIPDSLVFGLAIGGALQACLFAGPAELLQRLFGAVAAMIGISLFRVAYRLLRGQDGLGFGDVKFVAAAVPWIGLEGTPALVLLAVLSALVSVLILKLDGHELGGRQAISFGPHLALALWLIWVAGPISP